MQECQELTTDGRNGQDREATRAAEGLIAGIEADWARRLGASRHAELRRHLIDLIVTLGA